MRLGLTRCLPPSAPADPDPDAGVGAEPSGSIDDEAAMAAVLEPGDLLLCRGSARVSKIITSLDGWWSHTAMYVGTAPGTDRSGREHPDVPHVVHSYPLGVIHHPLWQLVDHYAAGGVARVRPDFDLECRTNAAEIAIARAAPLREIDGRGRAPGATKFGSVDLWTAAFVLARAGMRRSRRRIVRLVRDLDEPTIAEADIDELMEVAQERRLRYEPDQIDGREHPRGHPATCAAFAWRCYREAGEEIRPCLLRGVKVKNGRLYQEDETVIEALLGHAPLTMLSTPVDPLDEPQWRTWSRFGLAAVTAAPFLLSGTTLDDGISPSDLWCSPNMMSDSRMFLRPSWGDDAMRAQVSEPGGPPPDSVSGHLATCRAHSDSTWSATAGAPT